MASFPIDTKQDSRYFQESRHDISIKGEMEGGYAYVRRRTTAPARRRFSTGFTEISEADKLTFEQFFEDHGQFLAFDYTHPVTAVVYSVRFEAQPNFRFAGIGTSKLWTISDIRLTEA